MGRTQSYDGIKGSVMSTYTGSELGYRVGLPCQTGGITLEHEVNNWHSWEMKPNQAAASTQDTPWESPGSNSSLNRGNRS